MSDVLKVPALPDEYEAMFGDTVKDVKDIVMKIRGKVISSLEGAFWFKYSFKFRWKEEQIHGTRL